MFFEWVDHFIKFAQPCPSEKVLLILDGHKSHTQTLEALQKATESGIIMVSLPPHTSHRIQPLDISFFKPLKTYYYQQLDTWMRAHPGRAVSQFQFAGLFGAAYGKAASVSTALNGFRKSGISPLNRYIFEDHEFLPSVVTERPATSGLDHDDSAHNNANTHAAEEPSCSQISNTVALANLSLPAESTEDSTSCNIYAESPTLAVHVVDISPMPKKTHSGEPRRKMSKPTILTSSPHKRSLANAAETSEKVLKKKEDNI